MNPAAESVEKGSKNQMKRRENLDDTLLWLLSPKFHPSLAIHFGELESFLKEDARPKYQSLCLQGSKKDEMGTTLHMACLKDISKLLFMCCPTASKESKMKVGKKDEIMEVGKKDEITEVGKKNERTEVGKKNETTEVGKKDEISKACKVVSEIRAEVDKLSQRVSLLQASVQSGIKVDEKEFIISTELLMVELLKLDGVEAEGQTKAQRKNEVNRIQGYVDKLDALKARNSKSFS